jgi:tetratricopeptide (TPR) repeat protein
MKTRAILLGLVIFSLCSYGASEKGFWKNVNKGNYEKASKIAIQLAEENIDYMALSAICDHYIYKYESYKFKLDTYKYHNEGDYSTLQTLFEENYIAENYHSNNFLGVACTIITELKLKDPVIFFEKSNELQNGNPVACNYLSMAYLTINDLGSGIEYARKAIKADPFYPEPYNNLAVAYHRQENDQLAIETLIDCMKICPINTISTFKNFIALSCNETIIIADGYMFGVPGFDNDSIRMKVYSELKDVPHAMFMLAQEFYGNQSYGEAGSILDQIKNEKGKDPEYNFFLCLVSSEIGDTTRLNDGIHFLVEKKQFDFLLELGNSHFSQYEYEKALEMFEKAKLVAESKEEKVKSLSNIGSVHINLEKFDLAIRYFDEVIKIDETDDITLTNLGAVYVLKNEKEKAIEVLTKAKEYCKSDEQMKAIVHWLQECEKL